MVSTPISHLPAEIRFALQICVTETCWLWEGPTGKGGYGRMSVNYQKVPTHRFSYLLFRGPIPAGMAVCHMCDIRHCVNPAHLFLGTSADNTKDSVQKGRRAPVRKGQNSPNAKIEDRDIEPIRESWFAGEALKEIASRYGVTFQCIWDIVHGKTWKHLGGPIDCAAASGDMEMANAAKKERLARDRVRGAHNPMAVLSPIQVQDMRRLAKEGMSHKDIAAKYGVSRAHVAGIIQRRFWAHLSDMAEDA